MRHESTIRAAAGLIAGGRRGVCVAALWTVRCVSRGVWRWSLGPRACVCVIYVLQFFVAFVQTHVTARRAPASPDQCSRFAHPCEVIARMSPDGPAPTASELVLAHACGTPAQVGNYCDELLGLCAVFLVRVILA